MPKGDTFTWVDDSLEALEAAPAEVAPALVADDVNPMREATTAREDVDGVYSILDDEDDEDGEDEGDEPPVGKEAPVGYSIVPSPPPTEQLAFSKEKEGLAIALVGRSLLFKWPVVGWCLSTIVERNTDGRF